MDIKEYISSGIIESYVMGLCTHEEKNEMELLRRQYPELNKAVLQFETILENNLLRNTTDPGDATDERILQALQALQPPVNDLNKSQFKVHNFRWLKVLTAAAVLLLGISSVINYVLYQKNKRQELALKTNITPPTLPLKDYNVLKDPTITPVAMYGVVYHAICRCTMFWDKKTGKVYIMIHHLPRSSDTNDYQLWAMVNGKPVSVGIINDAIRDRFIELPGMPASANAFIVTLEKAGGSSSPTIEETYLAGKI